MSRNRNWNVRVVLCCALVAVMGLASSALALQKTAVWVGAAGGGDGTSYNDPLNWNIGEVPANGVDTYVVDIPGGVTVNYNNVAAGTVDQLTLAAGSTLNIDSARSLSVLDAATIGGIVTTTSGTFDAPHAASSFTGNTAKVIVNGTGNVTIGAASYTSTGISSGNIISADGTGSQVNLANLQSINDSENWGGSPTRTIRAINDGAVDLSGLTQVHGGTGGDTTQFLEQSGGTIDLTNLATVNNNIHFNSDQAVFSLNSLTTADGHMTFTLSPGYTLNLTALNQQNGGAYHLGAADTVNLDSLTQLTNARVTLADNASVFNAPVLGNIDNTFFNLSGGANLAINTANYKAQGFSGGTFFSADGGTTVLDLSTVQTIDSAADWGGSPTRTIAATNGGTVDLSNVVAIAGGTGGDTVEVRQTTGGVVNLASLTSVSNNVRFVSDQPVFGLPNLQTAGHLTFTLNPGYTLNLTALNQQNGGAYALNAADTVNLDSLTQLTNARVTLADNASVFNAPMLGNIDNTFFNLSGGANLILGAAGYDGQGFSGGTFFSADGGATVLNLAAVQTIDSSADWGGSPTRTIAATGGGTIDLSNLATLHGGQGGDTVEIKQTGGGAVLLDSLATTTNNVRFTTDVDLMIPNLQTAGSLFFDMQPGSTLDLPMLISQTGGAYIVPAGGSVNAPLLTSATSTTINISDGTAAFAAPSLGDINHSFITLSGGAHFVLPNVTNYTGTSFSSGTFFSAQGPGTVLDLSALESIDSHIDHGGSPTRTISASDSATIDLSAVATLRGGRVNDTLRIHVGSSAAIDLSALESVSTGNVKFDVDAEGTLRLGDFTVTGNTTFNINDLTSTVEVSGSLLLDSPSVFNVATGGGLSVGGHFSFVTTDETAFNASEGIVRMDGAGTFASPQFLEVGGADSGLGDPGNSGNFGLGRLVVGDGGPTVVSLVDLIDNGNRASPEALYLFGLGGPDGLVIQDGSTLLIDNINVYAWIDGDWLHLNSLFGPGVHSVDFGLYKNDGVNNGFIVIPEPASLALLTLAGLAAIRRRSDRTMASHRP